MNWRVKIFLCIIPVFLILIRYNMYQIRPIHRPLAISDISTQSADTVLRTSTQRNDKKVLKLKYILQWTSSHNVPFVYMGIGHKGFIENKCEFTNCYVTDNRSFFKDYTQFDVIVFNGPDVRFLNENYLPSKRSTRQKYVFASIESSHYYPVCSDRFDGYFNWTWTYRLDSETRWGYMIVRDMENKIIGPNKVMHWMKLEEMEPVSEEFKKSLKTKTKAAAWFVSNCNSKSKREKVVSKLKAELMKYNLTVDVYGQCGSMSCSRDDEKQCDEIVKTTYYFYLSFENSFSEDYVTEKLVRSLQNNAVPVVYGGANYTRFMPEGIYLDARKLSPEKLASKMNELIQDKEKYAEYFRWRNHYTYHYRNVNPETNDYCGMCKLLNDEEMVKKTSVYENFRELWNTPNACS